MRPLPNPELHWERSTDLLQVGKEEIERRIGPCDEELEVLSGGLANINVRVGTARVLRLYRRDAGAIPKEAMLLRRRWETFRSPELLEVGADFMLLEYVAHEPLPDTEESGRRVGQALAEIHAAQFELHGDFDETGAIPSPMPDFARAIRDHAKTEISKGPSEYRYLAELAFDYLSANAESLAAQCQDPRRLHGDFKASNLHLAEDGRLLVLDWEFAYAGPKWMDVGQLFRWSPSDAFRHGFEAAYATADDALPANWRALCDNFDLANLAGLLGGSPAGSRRAADVAARIRQSLGLPDAPAQAPDPAR